MKKQLTVNALMGINRVFSEGHQCRVIREDYDKTVVVIFDGECHERLVNSDWLRGVSDPQPAPRIYGRLENSTATMVYDLLLEDQSPQLVSFKTGVSLRVVKGILRGLSYATVIQKHKQEIRNEYERKTS